MTETVSILRSPEIKTYPVKEVGHMASDLFGLYYKFGQVTRERFVGNIGQKEGIARSPWARMERVRLLKKLERGEITHSESTIEKRKVDEIDLQFAKQKNFDIEVLELGVQSAYGTEVNLPDHLKSPEDLSRPPIFIVPALCGDLYGIEPLIKELALKGKRVISIAYPESHLGKTTEEFARSAEGGDNKTYEPHTSYFKEAIKKMIGQEGDIELWGYSTGCPIVAEILSDSFFQNRTKNAVLISPTSVVDQSYCAFIVGNVKEGGRILAVQHGWKTSDVSIVLGPKDAMDVENKKRRKRIFKALSKNKVISKMGVWKNVKVKEGGKVILLSAQKDKITKSNKSLSEFQEFDQYSILNLKKGSHLTPLTRARHVISKILAIQGQSNSPSLVQI